jgi:hypothetical protein
MKTSKFFSVVQTDIPKPGIEAFSRFHRDIPKTKKPAFSVLRNGFPLDKFHGYLEV